MHYEIKDLQIKERGSIFLVTGNGSYKKQYMIIIIVS